MTLEIILVVHLNMSSKYTQSKLASFRELIRNVCGMRTSVIGQLINQLLRAFVTNNKSAL